MSDHEFGGEFPTVPGTGYPCTAWNLGEPPRLSSELHVEAASATLFLERNCSANAPALQVDRRAAHVKYGMQRLDGLFLQHHSLKHYNVPNRSQMLHPQSSIRNGMGFPIFSTKLHSLQYDSLIRFWSTVRIVQITPLFRNANV